MTPVDAELAIGVDIGGTKIIAAVVDHSGRVIDEESAKTPEGSGSTDSVDRALTSIIEELVQRHQPMPVGVAVAGLVDRDAGRVRFAPHLPWREDALSARLLEMLSGTGISTLVVENDVNAALLAESRFGAAREHSDVIMVTVGTGLGGAVLVDGRLYRGRNGMAGEFGHLLFEPNGRQCECGLNGCWEQYASGHALTREMRLLGRDLTGPQILQAAQAQDREAGVVFATVGRAFGLGLAEVVTSLDPELVVIGGGVSAAGDLLLEPARTAIKDRLVGMGHRELPDFKVAELGAAAGAIGAAELARAGD